jgi:hypothetical protein
VHKKQVPVASLEVVETATTLTNHKAKDCVIITLRKLWTSHRTSWDVDITIEVNYLTVAALLLARRVALVNDAKTGDAVCHES